MRLLADCMLGRLARWLRLLGYDTAYSNSASDAELARQARAEGRVLLTRDHALAARRGLRTLVIDSEDLQGQVHEVIQALGRPRQGIVTRCALCNTVLERIEKDSVANQLPPYVVQTQHEFRLCPTCGRLYWPGTHYDRILRQMTALLDGLPDEGGAAAFTHSDG